MKKILKANISRRKLMKGIASAGSIVAMPGFDILNALLIKDSFINLFLI